MVNNISKKLIVVLGPTACGKTKIGAALAAEFDGEIISADSRQVYRGMDIGTGKDLVDYKVGRKKIPYHLLDVVAPRTEFNVARYQKQAYRAIDDILRRQKVPFLVGGTGLYIDAVTRGYHFVPTKPEDLKIIRTRLDKLSLSQLLTRLEKVDSKTYQIIDQRNRRRVQRALEIYYVTGKNKSTQLEMTAPDYKILFLGIKYPLIKIYQKIDSRLESRIKEGMIKEVKKLRQQGVSWKRLEGFGLEYRWVARYLQGKISYDELISGLRQDIHHFAKRQLTWFKRNDEIKWVTNLQQAQQQVKKFLK